MHVLLQSYNWATSVPFVLDNKEGRSIGCFSVTTESLRLLLGFSFCYHMHSYTVAMLVSFLSASLYVSKRGAY